MQNYDLTFFVMLNVVKNLLFSFEYKGGDPSSLSSLKGDRIGVKMRNEDEG